ncbi:hypothetical protein CJG01_24670 [Salmonella enterica]|nr:hypothetical protein [Salmonella enterica]
MNRTNFKKILSEMVAEKFDEENDALRFLINRMVSEGYEVDKNHFYLSSVRGGFEMEKLNRIQNYRKSFKVNQIKSTLKDVYDHIKIMNNKELQEEIERKYREEEKEFKERIDNMTYEQIMAEYTRECLLYGDGMEGEGYDEDGN